MATITVKESSAASAVGTNLLSGNRLQSAPVYRRVKRLGLVGAATVGAASVDLFYGSTFIGTFFNTSAGANLIPLDAKDIINVESGFVLEPNEPLNVLISAVGATNILVLTLEIEELS